MTLPRFVCVTVSAGMLLIVARTGANLSKPALTSYEKGKLRAILLAEAAKVSGYSVDHLGRLLRQGKIPNRGRRHSPKIQRGDLPIRPTAVARTRRGGYDPIADARNLLSRQGES